MSEHAKLLVWKWREDYDSPAKRHLRKVMFADVVAALAEEGESPALGNGIGAFLNDVERRHPHAEEDREFVTEYFRGALRFDFFDERGARLIPELRKLAKYHRLNSSVLER